MSYSEFHLLSDLFGGLYGLMVPHPLDILPITLYVFSKEQKYNFFSDSMGDDLLLLLFRKKSHNLTRQTLAEKLDQMAFVNSKKSIFFSCEAFPSWKCWNFTYTDTS